MIRGTRLLMGQEMVLRREVLDTLRLFLRARGFDEIEVSSLREQQTFVDKAGPELLDQMWAFKDKGERDVCLIPEVTGVLQEEWNNGLSRIMTNPWKVFYVQRCYRYERPQAGRYREFTQIGVEILGSQDVKMAQELLSTALALTGVDFVMNPQVKRGLSYYTGDGFEAESFVLGAQKQIAGGGAYKEGVGWAIGLDRLTLALHLQKQL